MAATDADLWPMSDDGRPARWWFPNTDTLGEGWVKVKLLTPDDDDGGDGDDAPPAVRRIPLGAGHEVRAERAGREVVVDEGGGVGRRAPPALELARVAPQLPRALGGDVVLRGHRHREPLGVLRHGGDAHAVPPRGSSSNSSPIRASRPRQSAS